MTLAGFAEATIEVKRSRFCARVAPVPDREAAREFVEAARREHWDARHHCSAFILGPGATTEHSSDDGEPAGTAGAPILAVLRGSGLTDVAAVVTRWFGGTLLGAGGLVRAYSDAATAALAQAPRLRRTLLGLWRTALPHSDAARIEEDLRRAGFTVLDVEYADTVTLLLGASPDDSDRLAAVLAATSAGTAVLRAAGDRWVDAPRPGQ